MGFIIFLRFVIQNENNEKFLNHSMWIVAWGVVIQNGVKGSLKWTHEFMCADIMNVLQTKSWHIYRSSDKKAIFSISQSLLSEVNICILLNNMKLPSIPLIFSTE